MANLVNNLLDTLPPEAVFKILEFDGRYGWDKTMNKPIVKHIPGTLLRGGRSTDLVTTLEVTSPEEFLAQLQGFESRNINLYDYYPSLMRLEFNNEFGDPREYGNRLFNIFNRQRKLPDVPVYVFKRVHLPLNNFYRLFQMENRVQALHVQGLFYETGNIRRRLFQTSALDLTSFPNLRFIDCSGNNLTSINTSQTPSLETLICRVNTIDSLDLTNNREIDLLVCDDDLVNHVTLPTEYSFEEIEEGEYSVKKPPRAKRRRVTGNLTSKIDEEEEDAWSVDSNTDEKSTPLLPDNLHMISRLNL